MNSDHSPLANHGEVEPKSFKGYLTNEDDRPHDDLDESRLPDALNSFHSWQYYCDKNHQDSRCIFCWVLAIGAGLLVWGAFYALASGLIDWMIN